MTKLAYFQRQFAELKEEYLKSLSNEAWMKDERYATPQKIAKDELENFEEWLKTREIVSKNKKYFDYLEQLRQSGETNMYGAAPYLAREFGLTKSKAKDILISWIQTYGKV